MTQSKTLTSLSSFAPTKECSHWNLIQEFYWEGGTRRVAASARVEKDNLILNRYRAYVGFLRGDVFPGWGFSAWELVRFQLLGQTQRLDEFCAQRLVGFHDQGLTGFHTEFVRGRVCFFGSGFRTRCIFWLMFHGQGVFLWLQFQGQGVFLCLDLLPDAVNLRIYSYRPLLEMIL